MGIMALSKQRSPPFVLAVHFGAFFSITYLQLPKQGHYAPAVYVLGRGRTLLFQRLIT